MNWSPSASITILQKRATFMNQLRQFFDTRGYLAVETPLMSQGIGTDVYLKPIVATCNNTAYWLQTSPEYHMKRLLAAGSGPIYQVSRAFRDDELGRWHNPEFTMLEWYQLGIDHHALLGEVDSLLRQYLTYETLVKKSYQEAFWEACDLDPFQATLTDFKAVLATHDLSTVLSADETDRDMYLFLLMSHVVEPFYANQLSPVAIYNFPASQAALAKLNPDGTAARFEVYYRGVELANGFHELACPHEQRARLEAEAQLRVEKGLPAIQPDAFFLAALDHGLPECSGVALGIDRLFALSEGFDNIQSVLSFDISRA